MSFRSGHSVVKRPADETGLKECFVKLVSQELLHIFPQIGVKGQIKPNAD